MALLDDAECHQPEQLAVLYCDVDVMPLSTDHDRLLGPCQPAAAVRLGIDSSNDRSEHAAPHLARRAWSEDDAGTGRRTPRFEVIVGTGNAEQPPATEGPAVEPARHPVTRTLEDSPLERTRLTVLNRVQLEEGEPSRCLAALRGSQARAVTTMLALRQNPVHKEELADLLWPRVLPGHWEGAIRGLITKIRRFLDAGGVSEPDALTAEGGYYELRLPRRVVIDRHLATDLLAAATSALAAGNPGDASKFGRRAITILRRRLLAIPDSHWVDEIRSELDRERLAALEVCARAELAIGCFEAAKRAAIEALSLDSYRESSYRLLMETHAAAGSRGEALRTYEGCRRVLADELGVGPSPQTQALYLHLLG